MNNSVAILLLVLLAILIVLNMLRTDRESFGALTQLSAVGPQDQYLISDLPQDTPLQGFPFGYYIGKYPYYINKFNRFYN